LVGAMASGKEGSGRRQEFGVQGDDSNRHCSASRMRWMTSNSRETPAV
jgi:hypothetical protein